VECTTGAWRTGAGAGAARTGAGAGRAAGADEELELELEELDELELLVLLAACAGSDNASAASTRPAGMIIRADVMTLPPRSRCRKPKDGRSRIVLAQFLKVAPHL
jgi:hypothetical protein